MRLYQVTSAATERLAYDGLDRIAEYACPDPCGGNGSNALQRRYVHGPGVDEPIVWYEGAGTTDRRFLSSDERGSIVSVTDSSGALLGLNRYDEYGNPQTGNLGTWGYTGQAWLPSMGVWYYKARDYDPELGRFLQTDPIDIEGGINLYAYVGNDPIDLIDPLGLDETPGATVTAPCPAHYNGGNFERYDRKSDTCYYSRKSYVPGFIFGGGGGGPGGPLGGSRNAQPNPQPEKPKTKKLPACAQKFLRGRISGDPSNITIHDEGGGLPNWFDNSVTPGTDVYLAQGMFDRTDRNALIHKFHEIGHASQNVRMGLNTFDHFAAYLGFGSHDASPLEQAASDFANSTYADYKAAGLDKTCPF